MCTDDPRQPDELSAAGSDANHANSAKGLKKQKCNKLSEWNRESD